MDVIGQTQLNKTEHEKTSLQGNIETSFRFRYLTLLHGVYFD